MNVAAIWTSYVSLFHMPSFLVSVPGSAAYGLRLHFIFTLFHSSIFLVLPSALVFVHTDLGRVSSLRADVSATSIPQFIALRPGRLAQGDSHPHTYPSFSRFRLFAYRPSGICSSVYLPCQSGRNCLSVY